MKFSKARMTLLGTLLLGSAIYAQGKPSQYTAADLVWQEDFEGKKLSTKDWNYEFHNPGWVNNELQSYGSSAKNTYLKDGCLVIQPVKTANRDGTFSYTSGRINTQGKHSFTYGRFEAKIKMPKGQGFLPAFWMMPEDESFYGQWPKCGEIDIMEILGNDPRTMYGTIHYGEPHNEQQGKLKISEGNFSDSFHEVAVEWEPGEIRFYCDGINYHTVNDWYTRRPGFDDVTFPAPFDQPFYIIFNVAVGGDWPGYPDSTTNFDERAQMQVDYVKVYQKKEYNEDVEKPLAAVSPAVTDSSGNMISSDEKKWSFLNFEGGKAEYSAKGGNLEIKPLADGPVLHAIQVVQGPLSLARGSAYRLSFDASADSERTIISCISAPNQGWIRYLADEKITLTKQKKHFSRDFKMTDNSDPAARLEFNCGNQGSLASVHISNIRLEKTGEANSADSGLNLLPDGNYIHNGQFQEGKDRLANWKVQNKNKAQVRVTNDNGRRELSVTNPASVSGLEDLIVMQDGLKLQKGKSYIIRFDAYGTKACKMGVRIGNLRESPALTAKKAHFEYLFTAADTQSYSLDLLLAAADTGIFVDNVSLKENSVLLNGNFENGMTAWELYAHQNAKSKVEITENSGKKEAEVFIEKTGNMDWMIQLKQNGLSLEKGKKYNVKFNAKSDLDRTIMWACQRDGSKDDNWIPYSGTLKINVKKDFQTFEHTFTMSNASDNAVIFTISMGAVNDKQINKAHTVVISDIEISEVK